MFAEVHLPSPLRTSTDPVHRLSFIGTLTADFRTGTYTYGSISPSTHDNEKTTKDLSEKEESSMNVSPIVAIFPSKIKVAIALIQFVVFVLGIGVLFRHALSDSPEP